MPFCPQCQSEYRAGISRCADCDVDLLPVPSGAVDLVLVVTSDQADAVRRALQAGGIATRSAFVTSPEHDPVEVLFPAQDLNGAWTVLRRFQEMEIAESVEPQWVCLFRGGVGRAAALRAALEAAGIPAQEPDEEVNTVDPAERATAEVLVPEEDLEAAREVAKGLDRIEGEETPSQA